MVIINEDQWDDIKRDFLNFEHEVREEPLIRDNPKKNVQEELGVREIHEFTKNDTDYMLIMDKVHQVADPNRFTYKLSIKYRDRDGSWKDSSALEGNFER